MGFTKSKKDGTTGPFGPGKINNNPVVNAIGKKNRLFIGEVQAGQCSVILFTIIEACRSRGTDPQTYLREVLTHLPTLTNRQIKDVTPDAWAKAQKAAPQGIWRIAHV